MQYDTFYTLNFKLLNFISENVRMNLNYWLCCDLNDYYNNFSGVYRNIRYSIESYYDLFNLSSDESYKAILKCNSSHSKLDKEDKSDLDKIYKEFKLDKVYHYTIKDKANISTNKNNLKPEIQEILKEWSRKGSYNSHPDPYQPPIENKVQMLEELVTIDCFILSRAVNIYICSFNKEYNTNYFVDIWSEWNKVSYYNSLIPTYIEY